MTAAAILLITAAAFIIFTDENGTFFWLVDDLLAWLVKKIVGRKP